MFSPSLAVLLVTSEPSQAAWVAGQYASINFSDQNNFRIALHSVVSGLRDPELPVRIDSVFALRSFVEACEDLDEIRPILPQLLNEFFKLMEEVENEDLVFTLETIVDKFGEEMAPYAFGLCQNLATAFWKCMRSAEAEDDADEAGALAAVGCLRAISTILESVSRLPHLFFQIEPVLLPILQKMLTTDGQEVFEEVLEIASYMTFFAPTISLGMWSLWPLMMSALSDWAIDFFPNKGYASGGVLISVDKVSKGYAIVVFRGKDYQRPSMLRPKNLLTKRKALARSIELQRQEALYNHISTLEKRVGKLRSEIEQMGSTNSRSNADLYDRLDFAYSSEDEGGEEEGDEAFLETYDDNETDGEEDGQINTDDDLYFDKETHPFAASLPSTPVMDNVYEAKTRAMFS